MSSRANLFLAAFFLLTFAVTVGAQSNEGKKAAPGQIVSNEERSAKEADAERVLKQRRAEARSLLLSLASDAVSFRDQTLRARSLARIADALWVADAERSRALFRKAWEAAEVADREGQQRLDEEIRQQKARTGGGYAVTSPPNLRGEVLRLAARRD